LAILALSEPVLADTANPDKKGFDSGSRVVRWDDTAAASRARSSSLLVHGRGFVGLSIRKGS